MEGLGGGREWDALGIEVVEGGVVQTDISEKDRTKKWSPRGQA